MNTKDILKKYNIRLTKSLGQNFLTDDSITRHIADSADISRSDLVLEIGPGIGSMTAELAKRAGKVIAIEIDKHLMPALKENLSGFPNVEIINEDVLKLDMAEVVQRAKNSGMGETVLTKTKVVANLPYYITTPIIMKLLEEGPGIDGMVFMVQKEVAERMAAKPGGKDYGALSVAVQYYSSPEKLFTVPPHCFIPQPAVDSAVIRLNVLEKPPVELLDKDMFFKTVKAAFGQRRKTLLNALYNSGIAALDKEDLQNLMETVGIDPNKRGETLTIGQFAQLANEIFQKGNFQ